MVAIPKTKVSTIRKKEWHDLSSRYSGTSNFGVVFPSFAREMMPKAKFKMNVHSTILNAPMPVPTFGEMFLNHKHVFVPYVDVCPQFESFLSAQSYTLPSGTSYVPTELPYLDLPLISQWCLSYFADFTIYYRNKELPSPDYKEESPWQPFLFERGYNQDDLEEAAEIFERVFHPKSSMSSQAYFYGKALNVGSSGGGLTKADYGNFSNAYNMMPLAPITSPGYSRSPNSLFGRWLAGQFAYLGDRSDSTLSGGFFAFNGNVPLDGVEISTSGKWNPSEGYVDILTADFVSLFGPVTNSYEYAIAFKLRSTGKHLFNILTGLGYQFTPNLEDLVEPDNMLKVFAFYKAWFNLYRPKRQMSFTQSNCYKLIKLCELEDAISELYPEPYKIADVFHDFLWDLSTDPYYYLPQDYFGMSVLSPNPDYTEDGINYISTNVLNTAPDTSDLSVVAVGSPNNNPPSVSIPTNSNSIQPAVIKIALGLLKHINKNSIVGKNIADFIKVHFGISLDSSHDLDKVYLIGEVSENVDISPVMSMAQTEENLGAYAGRGYGETNDRNEFEFENTNNTHGVWITLSCVVPKSGYYQGILKENRALKRFDFPQSDLDALGYEVLSRSEVSADYPVCTNHFNPHTENGFDRKLGFGFVPRQSAYKVGRDVVSGEMALRSGVSEFDGYHLNRKIPYENVTFSSLYDENGVTKVLVSMYKPRYIPNVVHDEFRRIDPTDRLGNYNRIFYSESVNDDHFILNFKFKVDAWLPLMSLADSFDTSQDNTEDIKIAHS